MPETRHHHHHYSPPHGGPIRTWRRQRVRGLDRDLNHLTLAGKKVRTVIDEIITDATFERTITGASTLTITTLDTLQRLQRRGLRGPRIDVELDGLFFRLAQVKKQGEMCTLVFEDREVAYMKMDRYKGPDKAYRDKTTRAEFIRSLVKKIKQEEIPCYIPELHHEPKIAGGDHKRHLEFDQSRHDKRGGSGGLDKGSDITVKHVQATPDQIHNIEVVLDTGASMGASEKVLISSIMTITQESTAQNLTGGDRDSVGLFQQRASMGWPASRDIPKDATAYFKQAIALDKRNPGMDINDICQGVQRSGTPDAYRAWQSEATNTVKDYLGGSSTGSQSGTLTTYKRYAFEQKRRETVWDCIHRLADEVGWRAFVSAGIFYYVADRDMFNQRIAMRIDESSPGVDSIDYDWDMGKNVTNVTVQGQAKRWEAPPGSVVAIRDFAIPEIVGRYIVTNIKANLFSPDVEITLSKPTQPKPEPAPEKVTKTVQFGDAGGMAQGGGGSTRALSDVHVNKSLGAPHWGGSADVMKQVIYPLVHHYGVSIGAKKEGGHAVGGDHDPSVTNAFATDFPTTDGLAFAKAVDRAFGNHSFQMESWNLSGNKFKAGGVQFRSQILWHAPDGTHHDHVHVGIRRV